MEPLRSARDKCAEHERRPDVGGEHKYGDLLQGLLLLLFVAVLLLDHFLIKSSHLLAPFIPWWARILIGLLILVFGWRLAAEGMRVVFGEVRQNPTVIQQGPFAHLRHPIYLGSILLYLAVVVMTLSLAAALVWLLIVACYAFLANYEEKLLLEKFGDAYQQYRLLVPMWIPRPKT